MRCDSSIRKSSIPTIIAAAIPKNLKSSSDRTLESKCGCGIGTNKGQGRELFQFPMDFLLRQRHKAVGGDHAGASVPTQKGVIIARGPDHLGIFVPAHRLT